MPAAAVMERGNDIFAGGTTSACSLEDHPSGSVARGSYVSLIRPLRYILAGILSVAVLVVLTGEGVVLMPSHTSPLHVWADVALVFLSFFLCIAAAVALTSRTHLRRHQKDLETTCDALEQSVASHTKLLTESNFMRRALFDAFTERVVIVDREDRIVNVNKFARRQIGYDPTGHNFSDVFPSCDLRDERRRELRLIQHTFLECEAQRDRLIRGGLECQSLLSIDTYPVFTADGIPQMVIEIARDVTTRVENEMRQHHHERMAALGMLAAGFAHDLGNPLASLSSELQLLRNEHDMDRIHSSFSVLEKHVERISRILHEILSFARRRSNRVENIAIQHVVRDALRLVEHDPRARNISFHVDLLDTIPSVRIGEDDLLLMLINLILNAFDAMPNGGQLSFGAEISPSGGVQLVIRDTGVGMDETLATNSVQPLYTTKDEGSGTGLGLPLCVDIMQAAGGQLTIQSEPGRGTSVILIFPPATHSSMEDQRHARKYSDR